MASYWLLLFWCVAASSATLLDCVELRGAGSSFVYTLLQDVIFQYEYTHSENEVSYISTGSGRGKCRIKDPSTCEAADTVEPLEVDFAASDSFLSETDLATFPDLKMYPMLAGAVVPVHNLPEVPDGGGADEALKLSVSVVARIYRCNITHWDDPAIRALNPAIEGRLPHAHIQIVARADSSGTTEIFKRALANGDSLFQEEIGVSSKGGEMGWPCSRGSENFNFRERTDGVAAYVLSEPYSLGYMAFGDADKMGVKMASLVTPCGVAVRPSQTSIAEALSASPLPEELRIENATGESYFNEDAGLVSGWPIIGYTSFIIRRNAAQLRLRKGATCEHVKETVRFLVWYYSSDVVEEITVFNRLTPMPREIRAQIVDDLMTNVMCGINPALLPNELAAEDTNFLSVPGTLPISLDSALSILPIAYKAEELLAQVKFVQSSSWDCTGGLSNEEWFRLGLCSNYGDELKGDHTLIPFALHPFVAAAHIPGLDALVLDLHAIRAIVHRDITHFNDPYLVGMNPQLEAVNEPIVVVGSHEDNDMRYMLTELHEGALEGGSVESCSEFADVCLATNAAASHYVTEKAYSFAVVPLNDVHANFDKLVASVRTESLQEVYPSDGSIHACMEERPTFACYPFVLRSTIILPTDYRGDHPKLATKAVEFWGWALRHPGIRSALDDVSSVKVFFGIPEHREVIEKQLKKLRVHGEVVLYEEEDNRLLTVATVAGVVVLGLILFGGVMLWRNHILGRKVARLAKEESDMEWTIDADTPIVKTVKFLQKLADGAVKGGLREEANELLRLMKSSDNLQLPSALAELRGGGMESEMPQSMKYIMGLGGAGRGIPISFSAHPRSSRQFEEMIPASPVSPSAVVPHEDREVLEETQLCVGAALDLEGLGKSFFCNVLHLNDHGITRPLTFITVNILRRNHLIRDLKLNEAKLHRFLLFVEDSYNTENPYHNNWHAADVTVRCAAIVRAMYLPDNKNTRMHKLAIILAACIHDAGHPGVDNNFMIREEEQLARSFNDQHVLEMHSLHVCLEAIRGNEDFNFLDGSALSGKAAWQKFKSVLINIVLATDMGQHFDLLSKFSTKMSGVEPQHEGYTATVDANLVLVLQVAMKAADLGHCVSRLPTHYYWSKCLEQEFFAQGDRERAVGIFPLSPLMNRDATSCMEAKSQLGFFDFIVMPLFTTLSNIFPGTMPMVTQAGINYRHWKLTSLQPEHQEMFRLGHYEAEVHRARVRNLLLDMEDVDVQRRLDKRGSFPTGKAAGAGKYGLQEHKRYSNEARVEIQDPEHGDSVVLVSN
eukprot:CAMPEP_0177786132 /NCGR_PEP_ID=MMETSP0491_2-20121128/20751_1 /TAXON_ID=63592 /ORGANISM="Tetraselmis chuii, Strain PLY429" /LENGTH=1294 /DNA_ID=CAMNT_0019307305 /DNA_START=95 /DNA_END=3979 /DNA_ORIENTATION=+